METNIIPIDTLTAFTGQKPDFTLLIQREHLSEQATLRIAKKDFTCRHCFTTIEKGTKYYTIVIAGSGLRGIAHPDRVHENCLKGWTGNDQ